MKRAIVLLIGLASVLSVAPAAGATFFASPSGSDSASGSNAQPFKTATKLVSRLAPGDTGRLKAGTYSENVTLSVPNTSLTNQSGNDSGSHATIQGNVTIARTATAARLRQLIIRGQVTVSANQGHMRYNDVSNPNGPGIYVGAASGFPTGLELEYNRIHHSAGPGFHIAQSQASFYRRNWIFHNQGPGVLLQPASIGDEPVHNIIDHNAIGLRFSGDSFGNASRDERVKRNVITDSVGFNIDSEWFGPIGTGNHVYNNVFWLASGAANIESPQVGFSLIGPPPKQDGNWTQNPLYQNAAAYDYRVPSNSIAYVMAPVIPTWLINLP